MNLTGGLNSQKGSIVVEASIVVPVVIFSIIGIIYLAALLYQLVCMQSTVNKASEKGALTWNSLQRDLNSGRPAGDDGSKSSLYWRLFDSDKQNKESRLKRYLGNDSKKFNIFSARDMSSEVRLEECIVYKKLIVETGDAYVLPGGSYLKAFGIGRNYMIRTQSRAVVHDPAELIRNTDFLLDMEKELEEIHPGLKQLGDKSRDVIRTIRDKVESLFK